MNVETSTNEETTLQDMSGLKQEPVMMTTMIELPVIDQTF
jgi:hypothetical protein